jgi:cyanophycinase-like exopeptidase
MGVVADTHLEERMAAAYMSGAALGGNSAGDAVQSVNMINGFIGDNGSTEGLQEGAVDLWMSEGVHDPSRGLIFGLANAIDEQHVYERGRIGRAINAAFTAGLPVIGMDAATGGVIIDEALLTDVVGYTSGIILDPLTWHADGAFRGPTNTLSTRGMATHLVPPGGFGYDLEAREPVVGGVAEAAPSIDGRSYPSFVTPAGAGSLFLSGGILGDAAGTAGRAFVASAGGGGARILVLAAGYARSTDAKHDAKAMADSLQAGVFAPVRWIVLDDKTDVAATVAAVGDATGIVLTAPDPSRVMGAFAAQSAVMEAVAARWTSGGAALLADDAAAAAVGPRFVADPIPGDVESESSEDFLVTGVAIQPGLGWIAGLAVAAELLPGQAWGDLYQLVAADPGTLAVGIDVATAVEVRAGAAVVHGDSAAAVLDGRSAGFGVGSNDGLSARWVVLDTFTDGEALAP